MIVDATPRFACRHEFVGFPLDARPEVFRCHKCGHSRSAELGIALPLRTSAARQAAPHQPARPGPVVRQTAGRRLRTAG